MATKGRKPLPTALKVLEGDRGKGRRAINKNEPTPPQNNIKCPDWLMPEAKKEWKRLAPSLIACEQTDRICKTMELDPKYATVIVERFHLDYPDQEITVLRDGKTLSYSEVATNA